MGFTTIRTLQEYFRITYLQTKNKKSATCNDDARLAAQPATFPFPANGASQAVGWKF